MKMNEVKALSHGSRACIKSLEVRNFCTKRKKASCYTREMITVLTLSPTPTKSDENSGFE